MKMDATTKKKETEAVISKIKGKTKRQARIARKL